MEHANFHSNEKLLPDISSYVLEESFEREEVNESSGRNTPLPKILNITPISNTTTNISLSTIKNTKNNFFTLTQGNTLIKLGQILLNNLDGVEINETYKENNNNNLNDGLIFKLNKVVFETQDPNYFYLSKKSNYGIIKCNVITTYFVDNYVFSHFTNFSEIEETSNGNYLFLQSKKKSRKMFTIDPDFITKFNSRSTYDEDKFSDFLNGVNINFVSEEYGKITQKYKYLKIKSLTLIIFLILLISIISILAFGFDFFMTLNSESICVLVFIFTLIILFLLLGFTLRYVLYICIYYNNMEFYEKLQFHISKAKEVEQYFADWNKDYFINKGLIVSTPVNLDYILINFNAMEEIELANHEIE